MSAGVAAGEVGVEAAAAIRELTRKRTSGLPVAEYVLGEPLPWSTVSDGGWDLLGCSAADGGADATLRDLAEVAVAWGEDVVPLPLLPSLLARRWSPAAREHPGPVTFSVAGPATPDLATVPFVDIPGTGLLVDTAAGVVVPLTDVVPDDYAPSLRLGTTPTATAWTTGAAQEVSVLWAAESVGCARRMLRAAVAYAREREQFQQPIGRFQAVKHHLADAHILVEQAESAVIWASLEPTTSTRPALLALDSSLRAAEIAVQVHGGLGFTWEMGLHVYLRHVNALRELVIALHR